MTRHAQTLYSLDPACGCAGSGVVSGNSFLFISTGCNQIIDILLSPDILPILAFRLFFMDWHSQNLYIPDPACGCADSGVAFSIFCLFLLPGMTKLLIFSLIFSLYQHFIYFSITRHSQN